MQERSGGLERTHGDDEVARQGWGLVKKGSSRNSNKRTLAEQTRLELASKVELVSGVGGCGRRRHQRRLNQHSRVGGRWGVQMLTAQVGAGLHNGNSGRETRHQPFDDGRETPYCFHVLRSMYYSLDLAVSTCRHRSRDLCMVGLERLQDGKGPVVCGRKCLRTHQLINPCCRHQADRLTHQSG